MKQEKNRVCPARHAWVLDNSLRRWLQNPRRILKPLVSPGDHVLDMGCGPGFWTLPLAELVGPSGHVVAVDLQEAMLEKVGKKAAARGLAGRITLHPCREDDPGLLPSMPPFDFMLLYYMVHETPDPGHLLEALRPWLRPGGTLLVVEPTLHVTREMFEEVLEKAWDLGYSLREKGRGRGGWSALLGATD